MLRNSRCTVLYSYVVVLLTIAPTLEKVDVYSCTHLGIVSLHAFMKLLRVTVSSTY